MTALVTARSSKPSGPWPDADPVHELTAVEKLFTLAGVSLGMLLAALDQTIVATAGPAIQHDLAMPVSLYPWLTTAYLIASTVLVPIHGKLSDGFGRKPILLAGIVLFLCGSLLCGFSDGVGGLLAARVVQGAGSAALFTSAFAVVADIFPPAARGRSTGLFAAVWGVAVVAGPVLGGVLTDNLGWRWVFFVNLPLGTLAIAFIAIKMPWLSSPGRARRAIDGLGALALTATVVSLLLGLSLGHASRAALGGAHGQTAQVQVRVGLGWTSVPVLALFATAAVGAALFVVAERRARDPILDLSLFANRVLAWGNAASFAIGASFVAGIVFLPLFLVNVVGLSATRAGLTLTPLTLGLVAGHVGAGRLVSRFGRPRSIVLTSLALLAAAHAILGLTLTPTSTKVGTTVKMILVGVGLGPSIPLITLAMKNAVPARQLDVATASATFFRQLGAIVGAAVLGTVFANDLEARVGGGLAGAPPPFALSSFAFKEAFSAAMRQVWWVGFATVVLGLLLTSRIPELAFRKTTT